MIQNVRSGQALTAGLLNSIISQANGQDIPSNQNFVNTDKGTLFVNNHDYEVGGSEGSFNKFLECWIDNAPEISNRPNGYVKDGDGNLSMKPYILVNIGDSQENACKNITVNNKPVDGIVLISNNESLDTVVTDEILENNYFVQLAEIDSSSENVYDVHFILFKVIKESDDEDEPPEILGYIFVISKEDIESAKDRAKSKITEIDGFDELTHLQMINKKKILAATKVNNSNVITQNVICSQDLIDENCLSSDTDVSDNGEKLNQYSVEIKSSIIEKEDDNGESIPTEVKYAQLYDFDDAEIKEEIDKEEIKKYSLLVRYDEAADKKDDESSDGESGDGESGSDSESSEEKLKELQYIRYIYYSSDTEETESDGSGSESSDKVVSKSVELIDKEGESEEEPSYIKYYQLYNFTSDSDKAEITLSVNNDEEEKDETSEDAEYSFLVRKKSDNNYELAYADLKIFGDLSAKSIFGDADDDSGADTKSIIIKTDEEDATKQYFQLYNFDNTDTITADVSSISDYDVLIRDGKELKYAKLSIETSVDNKSINYTDENKIQIFDFDKDNTITEDLATLLSSEASEKPEIVVRQDGQINYMSIGTLSSVSSEISVDNKSINYTDENKIQIFDFDKDNTITADISSINNYDVLVRDGKELKYAKLSIETSVDNKSINYTDENKIQIFDFDKDNTITTDVSSINNYDVLVRDGKELKYAKLSIETSVDNKSINYNDENQLQLFDFESGNTIAEDLATLLSNDSSGKPEIVIRQDGQINYMSIGTLSSVSSEISVDNKSINYTDENKIQLFDFESGNTITEDLVTLLSSETSEKPEIVVRKDGQINYMSIGTLSGSNQLSVAENTIVGISLEYSYDYKITLSRGRLVIEDNVLKVVEDSSLKQEIGTTPISEIQR